MNDNFSNSTRLAKSMVASAGGVVAAQHRRAAEAGARVLARGGDAADGLIATSLALGVLEPWMSGLGGGGAMVLYRARERHFEFIDFGMRASAGLDLERYRLSGEGVASDLFPWAHVIDERNVHGPAAIAVPGLIDGLRLAHERYARLDWRDLVRPAIDFAHAGLLIDWFAVESIASAAADLRRYPASNDAFLRDGLPPVPAWSGRTEVRLAQERLAGSLEMLATRGPRDFYEGALARRIVADSAAAGACLGAADLAAYHARVVEPLFINYRDCRIAATPELTAGPTLAHVLRILSATIRPGAAIDANTYREYAQALQAAYRHRLDSMGDIDGHRAPGCTSNFCVVDRDGNMAAATQTLLSIFGSRLVLAETGILMNNGIMWFDPEPGKPNSLAPGKRCLTNYCPLIGEQAGRRFALGASGGRRILPAVTQLLSFLADFGLDLEAAFQLPRIDASEGATVIGDSSLAPEIHAALAARFDYVTARRQTLPGKFACPSAVMHTERLNFGATEIGSPWADAVAASNEEKS